jgi:toxin FitB
MILLDTNVLSEPLKSKPSSKVIESTGRPPRLSTYAQSAMPSFRFDVMRMPEGMRKNDLAPRVEQALHLFKDRTLTFDVEAAEHLDSDPYPHRKDRQEDSGPRCIYRSHRHGA